MEHLEDDSRPTPPKRRKLCSSVKESDEVEFRKTLFYDSGSGSKFKFINGQTINFDKTLLCWFTKSPVFYQMTFGPLSEDTIEIKDIEHNSFKSFLDCILGFDEITNENAVGIFPIAHKYFVTECIEKCVSVIKPVKMNKDVCEILNSSFLYNEPRLCETVRRFILNTGFLYELIENEKFSFFLSTDSFSEVIKWVHIFDMDSCILQAIINWCNNFLRSNNKPKDVKNLLDKLGITERIQGILFESFDLFQEFTKTELGKMMFYGCEDTSREIRENNSDSKKCKWGKMQQGDVFIEEYDFDENIMDVKNRYLIIKTGKVVGYDYPKSVLSCTILLIGDCLEDSERTLELTNVQNESRARARGDILSKTFVFDLSRFDESDYSSGDESDYSSGGESYYSSGDNSGKIKALRIKFRFNKNCRIFLRNVKPSWIGGSEFLCEDKFFFTQKLMYTANITTPDFSTTNLVIN